MKSPFTLKSILAISMKKIFMLFSLIYAMNSYASNKHFASTDAFTNPCDASFTYAPNSSEYFTVDFFPSSVDSSNCVANWDFGDGNTSSLWHISHLFPHSGSFTVCLTIKSTIDTSCHDNYCTTVTIKSPFICTADFSSSIEDPSNHKLISFYNKSSSSDNRFLSWDFGDGETSSDPNPQHLFKTDGNYVVTLTVKSPYDPACIDTHRDTLKVVTIVSCNPYFKIYKQPSTNSYYLENLSTGTDINCNWDFGDGSTSNSFNPGSHSYAQSGTYTIRLTIYCNGDLTAKTTFTQEINIGETSCEAYFKIKQDSLDSHTYYIHNLSKGTNIKCKWDFGDGLTSTSFNPGSHTYSKTGDYFLSLKIYCNGDSTISSGMMQPLHVGAFPDCISYFTIKKDPSDIHTYYIQNLSSGTDVKCKWDFGDGFTSTSFNPGSHTYSKPGEYTITLTTACSGDTVAGHISSQKLIVSNNSCHAYFYIHPDSTTTDPYDFIVYNLATGVDLNYHWDFGDGETSNIKNPNHQYDGTGPYKICLSVSNDSCYDVNCYSLSLIDTLHPYTPGKFSIHVMDKTTGISELTSNKVTLLNYPNPFDNSTTITYEIKAKSDVSLSVFNILGNKLQVLENTTKQAGSYSVEWTPQDLSEGLYILQLKVNDQLITKKVIKN